jgi:GNAT superfamily N-acetyltransferase
VQERGMTRENSFSVEQLRAIGVTVDTWRDGIADSSLPGHVCLFEGEIIGYCFGAPASGEIVVLALLPAHEQRGLGRALLNRMVSDLHGLGHRRLFLGCSADPAVRSYGFYRHEGWTSTGTVDAVNDEVLELFLP